MLALFTFNNPFPWLDERVGSVVYLLGEEDKYSTKIEMYKNNYESFKGAISSKHLIKLEELC